MWHRHSNLPDVAVRYRFDPDGVMYREKVQDVEPVIENAKAISDATGGWNKTRTAKQVASIPSTVYYNWIAEWQREGRLDIKDPNFSRRANDLCLRRIRDGEFSKFRV